MARIGEVRHGNQRVGVRVAHDPKAWDDGYEAAEFGQAIPQNASQSFKMGYEAAVRDGMRDVRARIAKIYGEDQ